MLCGDDFDEKDTAEATDIYEIPSVTGEWVKASIRLGRLASPKVYHPIPSGIFLPCVVAIAQLNANDRKKLYALITFHGGRVERNFTSKTTHLVCGIATGDIYTKAMDMKSGKFCIITPDWFYECLKVQELIDPKPYHPRLLEPTHQNSLVDTRSLSSILEWDDIKTEIKKTETTKPISVSVSKPFETTQSISKSVTTSSSVSNTTMTPLPPIVVEENKPKVDKPQPKPMDNSQLTLKNAMNQEVNNQNKPIESNVKPKIVSFFLFLTME